MFAILRIWQLSYDIRLRRGGRQEGVLKVGASWERSWLLEAAPSCSFSLLFLSLVL